MRYLLIIHFIFLGLAQSRADVMWKLSPENKKTSEIAIKKIDHSLKNMRMNLSLGEIQGLTNKSLKIEKLKIKDWQNSKDLNRPSLPYKSFLLSGENIKSKIKLGKKVLLEGVSGFDLEKFEGEKCRCRDEIDQKTDFLSSKKIKNRPLVLLTELGDFRGEKIYKVEVSPFVVQGQKVFVYPQLQIELSGTSPLREFSIDENKIEKNILLVYPASFANDLTPYVDYKKEKGFKVSLFELASSISFLDMKNKIHKMIKENNIFYLVLVGHEKLIPTQYVPTLFDKHTPSDLELTTLGEEGADFIPDVFSSRISASSSHDIELWINKTILYENTLPSLPFKSLALASNEGTNPSDQDYVELMSAPLKNDLSFQVNYFFQGSEKSRPEEVIKAINEGADFINYIGHGSGYSWPSLTTAPLKNDHLNTLDNENRWPVVLDVACQNGRFEGKENGKRFGETFIFPDIASSNKLLGAVAYYGGTVDISWDPPAIMAVGFSAELNKDKNNILGPSLLKAGLYLLKNYSDLTQVHYNFIWYHLQGDPSLKLPF